MELKKEVSNLNYTLFVEIAKYKKSDILIDTPSTSFFSDVTVLVLEVPAPQLGTPC